MSYDKDVVYDLLAKTGAVELKTHSLVDTSESEEQDAVGGSELTALETVLQTLSAVVKKRKAELSDVTLLEDGFAVPMSEFLSYGKRSEALQSVVEAVEKLSDERNALQNALQKARKEIKTYNLYKGIKRKFSDFAPTKNTVITLGTVSENKSEELETLLSEQSAYEKLAVENRTAVYCVVFHKSERELSDKLSEIGFIPCPFHQEISGEEAYKNALQKEENCLAELERNETELYAFKEQIKPLKCYADYLGFVEEKRLSDRKAKQTEKTFWLEGYVPENQQERVETELKNAHVTTYYEFADVPEDEIPPTVMENNKVVKNFESITNMYSAPSSKELDPNTVMAFFYSLFLGFIMGDLGYGLIMLLGGLIVYKKTERDCGLKRLAGVFAVGGIFAVIWGFLFNSCLGLPLPFMKAVMPNAEKDNWQFVGIAVPSVLIISLLLGVFQLLAGYVMKAVQCFKRKEIAGGIFEGLLWAFFSLGVGLAIVGFTDEMKLPTLKTVGGLIAGISLALAVLTAGYKEKFFGKFTKGFGAAYGVINYASDILSYARLYGLMLSGVVIAEIVSDFSVGLITGGNVILAILGIVLMLFGHGFNLAIGLLGAYIHDARLQYVEFYGKFFEGEGELFTPLGSKRKYVYLTDGKE